MIKIGSWYGAEVSMETKVENKKGWVKEYPNLFDGKEIENMFAAIVAPYRKFPELREVSYMSKSKKMESNINFVDTEIDSIEIIVKYKEN